MHRSVSSVHHGDARALNSVELGETMCGWHISSDIRCKMKSMIFFIHVFCLLHKSLAKVKRHGLRQASRVEYPTLTRRRCGNIRCAFYNDKHGQQPSALPKETLKYANYRNNALFYPNPITHGCDENKLKKRIQAELHGWSSFQYHSLHCQHWHFFDFFNLWDIFLCIKCHIFTVYSINVRLFPDRYLNARAGKVGHV